MSPEPALAQAFGVRCQPLPFNQEGQLLSEEAAELQSLPYPLFHISMGLRFTGQLDIDVLRSALGSLVDRHDAFRTAFHRNAACAAERPARLAAYIDAGIFEPGLYQQSVLTSANLPFEIRDVNIPDALERRQELQRIFDHEHAVRFNYEQPPLMRAVVLRLAHDEHILVLFMHHLITDMWSGRIIRAEIEALYKYHLGYSADPPAPPATRLIDFANWQQARWRHPPGDETVAFWDRQWQTFESGQIGSRSLPFGATKPSALTFRTGMEVLILDGGLYDRTIAFARRARVTIYVTFLTVLNIVLHHYTGQQRLAVWGRFANRLWPKSDSLIGYLATTHPIGVDCASDPTGEELLQRVNVSVLRAMNHQSLPVDALWRILGRRAALADIRVSFDLFRAGAYERDSQFVDQLQVRPVVVPVSHTLIDLDLYVFYSKQRILTAFGYSIDRFEPDGIREMVNRFRTTLERLVLNPEQPMSRFKDL